MQLSSGATAWLKSLVVSTQGGWSYDLSSQFQSNVSDYGVIVPAEFDNATLCTLPFRGAACSLFPRSQLADLCSTLLIKKNLTP